MTGLVVCALRLVALLLWSLAAIGVAVEVLLAVALALSESLPCTDGDARQLGSRSLISSCTSLCKVWSSGGCLAGVGLFAIPGVLPSCSIRSRR
jgi:hypothetical protein